MADFVLRASVRRVVEFTLKGGDITPASMAALQAGTRGHKARQQAAGEHAERRVQWSGEYLGMAVEISGRIDILHESGELPLVEEIKLTASDGTPPVCAVSVHRMQAVCYAHMLCEECRLAAVAVQITYVTEQGEVRASFPEILTAEEAKQQFFSMLTPFVQWEKALHDFKKRRDETLHTLPFPYPSYRQGQREMAAQVYTAIKLQKRLFATLPTGTGKSAATLYPALKALGEGKTRQIFYLTARGTAQQSALDALQRMREKGLKARSVVITAKEKCCSMTFMRCHPDHCPRAKGYYDRERNALRALMQTEDWSFQRITAIADAHMLCPFELSLSLCEIADVVICDYNYAFDPAVLLRRVFEKGLRVTLLIDEAHNLPARVRSMLSALLSSRDLSLIRREVGKLHGRKSALYKAFTPLLQTLRNIETSTLPEELDAQLTQLIDVLSSQMAQPQNAFLSDCFRDLLALRAAMERWQAAPEGYQALVSVSGKERTLQILSLDIAAHVRQSTRKMTGCVFFSATLEPLLPMKNMLGGEEEDAVFSLPSPFPPENLLVLQRSVDTRYARREETIDEVAQCILSLFDGKSGSYIAFFPSYAYMALAAEKILSLRPGITLNLQQRGMDDASREAFLERLRQNNGPLLSLCVLGGVFSEGVDLPGLSLIGAAIIGVGLPQVNEEQECLRRHYESTLHDGFSYAYRYPGMHKVLQAAGRIIRSETDVGALLLLDARYQEFAYAQLLPAHYRVHSAANADEIRLLTKDFWQTHGIIQ